MSKRILKNKFVNIDKNDERYLLEALWRGQLSGTAEVVEQYEEKLCEYFKTKFALAFCNGTLSIHAALLALGISQGDEVILPATAPVMTALPILLAHAKPVFADTIAGNNFGFDLNDLEKKLTNQTKAIICVPMWGYPIEMEGLLNLSKNREIPIIEDVAQAHGTKVGTKYLGTFGDIGSFSTHDRKLICTGEGGVLMTSNKLLFERLSEIRTFGRVVRNTPDLESYQGKFGVLFGLNYKINALGAAIGISQLEKLNKKLNIRKENANFIKNSISDLNWISEIQFNGDSLPNYYALVLEIKSPKITGSKLSKYLYDHGIISDTFEYDYKPLYELPLFNDFISECPNTKILTNKIITLPTHEGLTKEDLEYIVQTLSEFKI